MHSEAAAGRVNERYARPLFLLTIVTGSFLLFLTQPMIARMALPRIGGAPSVWNSAMLVYQFLLLAGYAYAHWVARMKPRRQAGIHIVLFGVAALWLPIGLTSAVPPATFEPAIWVPWFLLNSIGPVFFIVSAQAPLMQRWYALETSRGDPYPLYAASNLGSFAGLISYPLIVEPLMTLQQQSWLWTGIYAALVLLVIGCALTVPADAVEVVPEEQEAPPTIRRTLHWIALAAVPSGLMLSTTTHLTTDIVAMPLLWVLPLGLYLLSWVIAFAARRKPAEVITIGAPLVILICGGLAFSDGTRNPFVSATMGLALLFAIAVALHSEMFRLRPAVGHLTRFYLAMSFGGMLGGLFCAIVAPLLFDWAYEHPLLILGAALLVPQYILLPWPSSRARIIAIVVPLSALALSYLTEQGYLGHSPMVTMAGSIVVSLFALACLGRRWAFTVSLAALMLSYGGWSTIARTGIEDRTRSYFGIYEVYERPDGSARVLTHGTTLHGIQNLEPGLETMPTSYYARRSGVGLVLDNANALFGGTARIGVIGLGSGTLSCYHQPGQRWTFFEIDPAMVDVARNRFSFLNRCAPDARIVLGDARLSMAREPANSFDVLAVDAFSSDSVPMHLLTREALRVYGRAVQPNGIVLFHVSNRYLDLKPVVADIARREGWTAWLLQYVPEEDEQAANLTISVWIALSRNPETLNQLYQLSGADSIYWEVLEPTRGFSGWSDDHASILSIINYPDLWPGGE
ncbi:fused MFS/spermidine synthase [Sphingosinicella sp. LHD-64]|uniref:fused MFS/spermidine synthase n=1 Tax=Sphingosinicella sp. LHD-64 TaxID=3072139 RepID=UPI0028109126|nr:fused MFS/spermidine synthase [Sphingosinicella sp. LHD-64]MDQ8754870.1 fused MFS/spermidine synthase [Sphingosinicella sp. LHD-64]